MIPFQILLVEDNQGDVLLIKEAFSQSPLPFILNSVNDGSLVFDFLNQNSTLPDLILTDINMPETGGIELLGNLKEDDKFSSIPVFMLTSSTLNTEIELARSLGANGFIVKGIPFALQNLLDYAAVAKHTPSTWVQINQ